MLTLSLPEALHRQVKASGVRQSIITKGTVLAGLGEERFRASHYNFTRDPMLYCKYTTVH